MDNRIETNLKNAQFVAESQYTALICPNCKRNTNEAFFSADDERNRFGIWFECSDCGNVEHISCGRKPDGFNYDRLSPKFQEMDERAWMAEKEK